MHSESYEEFNFILATSGIPPVKRKVFDQCFEDRRFVDKDIPVESVFIFNSSWWYSRWHALCGFPNEFDPKKIIPVHIQS